LDGCIDRSEVGAHDASDRLTIPERLYGREREIDTLLAAFDRVVGHGTPELVLVSGYSGIGKSSLVNELQKVRIPPRGLFASGKFDQYQHDIPYATLAQAFQSLLRPLLGQSEEQLGRWREALSDALGRTVSSSWNLVPQLELVIGTQPPVPELLRRRRSTASRWCSGASSAYSRGRSTRSRCFSTICSGLTRRRSI